MLIALLLAASPVTIASKTDLLDFSYSWSAEANAVPALRRRFQTDATRQRSKALQTAREDRSARSPMADGLKYWNGHYFMQRWTTAGKSPRLLSLQSNLEVFTGGAHGNRGTSALLWDRRLNRSIDRNQLLSRPGWWDGAVRQPFCTLLDGERSKRRQEPVRSGDWPNQCPEIKELTLTLVDQDRDSRFDHIRVTADPYVAGAYAEGEYVISLPITAAMIARLKPQYRASFRAQPPVQ